MRGSISPPKILSPKALFELLCLRSPRYSLPGTVTCISGNLEARAISASELATCKRKHEIVAKTLLIDGELAFASGYEAGLLRQDEIDELHSGIRAAFDVCCPMYGSRFDVDEWIQHLKQGAAESRFAGPLACCVDYITSPASAPFPIDRPERYWGLPVCDLLDGHWMAFRAARALVEK